MHKTVPVAFLHTKIQTRGYFNQVADVKTMKSACPVKSVTTDDR
jgi:hypothetical protein